jgi:hypothetical protein
MRDFMARDLSGLCVPLGHTGEVDAAEAITPERVRAIHRECLAKLEAEQGESFRMLRRE